MFVNMGYDLQGMLFIQLGATSPEFRMFHFVTMHMLLNFNES